MRRGCRFWGSTTLPPHIAANFLSYPELTPPFTCLVASGGHSHIILVEDYDRYRLIGRTRDDAAGEAFDKVARVLGLSYPGGPNLEKLALEGDPTRYRFHSAFNEGEGVRFQLLRHQGPPWSTASTTPSRRAKPSTARDLAASFQKTVVDILAEKSVRAAKIQTGEAGKRLALAGGVSANRALWEAMERRATAEGIAFYCPAFQYCTGQRGDGRQRGIRKTHARAAGRALAQRGAVSLDRGDTLNRRNIHSYGESRRAC